jgi:hypothetical protein
MNLSKASINLAGFISVCVLLVLNSNSIKKLTKTNTNNQTLTQKEHTFKNVKFLIPVTELVSFEKPTTNESLLPRR